MKKLVFLQKKLDFSPFLCFIFYFLFSCNNNQVEANYNYSLDTNQITVSYINNTDNDYLLIVPKILFLDPYDSGKIIRGMDGIYLRKKANIIIDKKLNDNVLYNNSEVPEFYILLSIEKRAEFRINYNLSEPMVNDKFKKYKIYISTKKDYESPFFRENLEKLKKIKYKSFVLYINNIEYSGDIIILR